MKIPSSTPPHLLNYPHHLTLPLSTQNDYNIIIPTKSVKYLISSLNNKNFHCEYRPPNSTFIIAPFHHCEAYFPNLLHALHRYGRKLIGQRTISSVLKMFYIRPTYQNPRIFRINFHPKLHQRYHP